MSLKTYIEELKSKKVAVIGVGISNRPLIRLLTESGVDVTAYDKRTSDKLGDVYNEFTALGVKFVLGDDYLDSLTGDVIFRTPGLHPDTPALVSARERGAVVTSEMEAFFEICPCRMVAVTGSDGKTTTTSVIAELLRSSGFTVHVGGNIGNPLFCDADKMQPEDFAVLELSSFQLMTMKRSAEIAVVTNLGPNHLDIHHGMQEYIDAKKNVFLGQSENGRVVLNLDNDYTRDFAPLAKGETVFFSRTSKSENCVFCENGAIYDTVGGKTEKIMDTDEIFLPGVHNIENYMAAFAAVRGIVPHDICRRVAMTFRGVAHRIELVRELGGVRYYNDSIASSPSRTIAGLRSFKQKVILIAGGKDKGVPFDSLGPECIEHVKTLVLTGFTADKLRAAVENAPGYCGSPNIITVEGFRDAVITAQQAASDGDIVILSPACTSFDRFANFEERGNVFKAIVNELE